jgi:DNA-binding NtrC family response regulator
VSFSANVVRQLKRYDWPGNIRELKNLVAKAKAYFGHKISKESQLQELLEQSSEVPCSSDPTAQMLTPVKDVEVPVKFNSSVIKDLEQEIIRKRLIANKGNQRQTALDLGIPKSTLHDRLKTYGIKVSK